jgi:hypothetical protein
MGLMMPRRLPVLLLPSPVVLVRMVVRLALVPWPLVQSRECRRCESTSRKQTCHQFPPDCLRILGRQLQWLLPLVEAVARGFDLLWGSVSVRMLRVKELVALVPEQPLQDLPMQEPMVPEHPVLAALVMPHLECRPYESTFRKQTCHLCLLDCPRTLDKRMEQSLEQLLAQASMVEALEVERPEPSSVAVAWEH